jgi:hypothetical protein
MTTSAPEQDDALDLLERWLAHRDEMRAGPPATRGLLVLEALGRRLLHDQ